MKTHTYGSCETWKTGIHENSDQTYTAVTWSNSKTFKTRKGAEEWIQRQGYNVDGSKKR